MAALLGGVGTVVGVLIYQAPFDMVTRPQLQVRWPAAVMFLATIFLVGAAGGTAGHVMFLRLKGQLTGRALLVGGIVGVKVAIAGWTLTWIFRGALFPFEPFEGMDGLMVTWLFNALFAGPLGGVLAALAVVGRLRRLTGQREPLGD